MKRIKNSITAIVSTAFLSLSVISCSDYLDVNENPNYPTDATKETLLPSASATTIAQFGLNGTLMGNLWLQHATQGNSTNQYNTTANYSMTTSTYNYIWTNAYANTLPDLKLLIAKAEEENAWGYWLIAKVLMAYNFHMLTDLYGDIPFTEALDAKKYPHPKYDDSKSVVYPGILNLLDEAIAKERDADPDPSQPRLIREDLFLGGDISKWVAFAKNLKLKVLMRDFEANKMLIQGLLEQGGLLEANCAFTVFEDATDKGNPLYEYNIRQLNTVENMRACHTLAEFLLEYNDPRIENIYEIKGSASGQGSYREKYEGLPCGTKPSTTGAEGVPLANSSRFKQRYDDPVYLMNNAEIAFLISEAYARLGDKANSKKYYETGVTNSFNRWPESSGKATEYIAEGGAYAFDPSSLETMLKCILIQKWVSYACANTIDGVFDRNRTGIPAIDPQRTVRVSNAKPEEGLTPGYVLGTLVAPGASVLQSHEYPRRMLVPNISKQYNENAPDTKPLTEKMWWQVESGK